MYLPYYFVKKINVNTESINCVAKQLSLIVFKIQSFRLSKHCISRRLINSQIRGYMKVMYRYFQMISVVKIYIN